MAALFPMLLGSEFDSLHSRVKAVHGGAVKLLGGVGTIERGPSLIARLLCALAMLPQDQAALQVEVEISALADGERWTRRFGTSAPMRSVLRARNGLLVERLGLLTMSFRLTPRDGGIDWLLVRIAGLGCPLPRRLFRISTYSGVRRDRYQFMVDAALAGVGKLIRYEGELDVIH